MLFTVPEELALVKGMKPEYFKDEGRGKIIAALNHYFWQ